MSKKYSPYPLADDGSPRVYAGMHREPWEEIARRFRESGATVVLSEHRGTIYPGQWRQAWLEGEWDLPLYVVEGENDSAFPLPPPRHR